MAAVSTFQGLVFLLVMPTFFAVNNSYCTSESDCLGYQSCCSKICVDKETCEGYSCSTDSDCGVKIEMICCGGTCMNESTCSFVTKSIIQGSVLGGLIFIGIVTAFIYCACRRRQITARPPAGEARAANTGTSVLQLNTPYPGQVPPAFQQSYPHNPPPLSEPHQTLTLPPSYNSEATGSNEPQPPSYSEATGATEPPPPSYSEATQGI